MLNHQAIPIRTASIIPIQNALKLPATIPESIFKEEPPSFEALTTSFTCFDEQLVKTFVSSGIIAAAKVPQLTIPASLAQRNGS